MIKKMFSGLVLLLLISQSGCGWLGIRDRSNDYLLAEESQPIVVPEDLDGEVLGQVYPIPQIPVTSVELVNYEVPRPQAASVNTFEQSVKIQSFSGRSWVLINVSPSEVWPRVRSILNRNGIPASRAEGASGIIETVWLKFNSDPDNSHRFRFQMAPGVQVNSSEISVLHQQAVRGDEESAAWNATSSDEQREKDMLQMVATDLANAENYAAVSLLAQNIGGESKVEIITPEVSDPYILIKLNFDRAWASVTYSTARGGYATIDQNRSQGLIFVNYTEPSNEEEGFFSRWFGGDSSDILEVNYRVLVQEVGPNIEVRVVGPEGEALEKAEALRLLKVLRNNMS